MSLFITCNYKKKTKCSKIIIDLPGKKIVLFFCRNVYLDHNPNFEKNVIAKEKTKTFSLRIDMIEINIW